MIGTWQSTASLGNGKSRMFRCNDCGEEFDAPEYYIEYHGDASAPGERWAVCPRCGDTDFEEIIYGGGPDDDL